MRNVRESGSYVQQRRVISRVSVENVSCVLHGMEVEDSFSGRYWTIQAATT